MGYWGWRRMLTFCVSVLVVGCSTNHEAAPTFAPTQLPPVTLMARVSTAAPPPVQLSIPQTTIPAASTPTYYTIQVGDTLLGIAAQFGVPYEALKAANADLNPLALPINQTILIPNPQFDSAGTPILPTNTPAQLELPSPTCYPSPTSTILCMGWVANNFMQPIERVTLHVSLLRANGSVLAEGDIGVEQGVIPTGVSAPYRIVFSANWLEYTRALVTLQSADVATSAEKRIGLSIEDEQQRLEDGAYVITATLRNDTDASVRLLRAVLTLRDDQGRIIGYRVMPLHGDLAGNDRTVLDISAIPQINATVSHTLFVEALRGN